MNAQIDTLNYKLYSYTSQFKSIEDILSLPALKNKVVYFDMWGTRCSQCINEFLYLPEMKNRYKNKEVVFAYLKAPYDFDDSKDWKSLLLKHHLEGINIAMSINFYSNNFWLKYENIYPKKRLFMIPVYLIADKNGKIVDYDASHPSSKEKLYYKLDQLL